MLAALRARFAIPLLAATLIALALPAAASAAAEFTLTVDLAGKGEVEVECEVEGGLPEPCAAKYPEGTELTLRPKAGSGSEFVKWSGCDSMVGDECEVEMGKSPSVTATFNAQPGGGGSGSGGGGSSSGGGGVTPGTAIAAATATVKGGKAALELTYSGGPCRGSLKLIAKLKQGKKTKNLAIGQASFNLATGASATLNVKLSNPAQQEFARGKKLRARLGGAGIQPRTVTLKLAK